MGYIFYPMKNLILIALLLITYTAQAQVDPVDNKGLALGGYDVVSYFTDGTAAKGDARYSSTHRGTTYYFISADHQQAFAADPERYLPEFEGYCALAVSYGKKISVDPETFKITDGKLYLFYHGKSGSKRVNSLETWNKNEQRLLKKAQELWPDVKKKNYKMGDTL